MEPGCNYVGTKFSVSDNRDTLIESRRIGISPLPYLLMVICFVLFFVGFIN